MRVTINDDETAIVLDAVVAEDKPRGMGICLAVVVDSNDDEQAHAQERGRFDSAAAAATR